MHTFWVDFKTFMWVRYFNCKDLIKTVFYYWRKPKFAVIDASLLLSYFFKSPYRIAREHNDQEPYGETPLVTLDAIIKHCPISNVDTVYELGSGRGRACFWLSVYKGYNTVGVEYIPAFVAKAQKLAAFFGVKNVQFRTGDILKSTFEDATWIYLFGSALPDASIITLCSRLQKLKAGTKIITISYPLTAYTTSKKIALKSTLELDFSWGKTQVYFHSVV